MGYTTLLDIVGSVIMGGLLMVILLRTNSSATENTYNYSGDVVIQQSLSNLVNGYVDSDFRKIGYSSDQSLDRTTAITYADTSGVTFKSDIKNNGTICTIKYYLGPKSQLAGTTNPNDMILYREVTAPGQDTVWRFPGVTIFKLLYFGSNNGQDVLLSSPVAITSSIVKIQIYVKMESAIPYSGNYVSAYWNATKEVAVNTNR
jgi:hypothetical protein